MTIPAPPAGSQAAGKRLWRSVVADFELDEHELALLRQAARVADHLDELSEIVSAEGVMRGDRAHPAVVEHRQQSLVLGRLIVALRLPAGAEGDHQASARQPRRSARGVYALRPAT